MRLSSADLERTCDARTGERLDPLPDEMLHAIADDHLVGTGVAEMEEGDEFNCYYAVDREVAGEVVQRRPAIWRAFGPFLAYHTFGFTGNPWLDTILLTSLQLAILVMVVTGWRLAIRRGTR